MLATCDDECVIGAPFYVMELIEGDVLNTRAAGRRSTAGARIGDELVDALVEVHAVDWRACGLEGYGKPTGYLDRQLRRFTGLWEHNRTRELAGARPRSPPGWPSTCPSRARDDRPRRLPARQRDVRAWRAARLNAIFDWELATIGDPLADVGYLVATLVQPGEPTTRCAASAPSPPARDPTREQLIARYEERSGPLDVRRALVHDARPVEVGGVPRGLLQAALAGPPRTRSSTGSSRRAALAERAWRVAAG